MATKPKWEFHWAAEHGPSYEVPGLINYMVFRKILTDDSWHNDTMPRFHIVDPKNDERGVTILVDHPVGSMRETGPGGKRFLVQFGDLMSDTEYDLETDDLEQAITTALRHAEKILPKGKWVHFDHLVREWMESTAPKY